MQVEKVRCFGAAPGSGNVALVIENGPSNVAQRQAYARDAGHSACVFITAIEEVRDSAHRPLPAPNRPADRIRF